MFLRIPTFACALRRSSVRKGRFHPTRTRSKLLPKQKPRQRQRLKLPMRHLQSVASWQVMFFLLVMDMSCFLYLFVGELFGATKKSGSSHSPPGFGCIGTWIARSCAGVTVSQVCPSGMGEAQTKSRDLGETSGLEVWKLGCFGAKKGSNKHFTIWYQLV